MRTLTGAVQKNRLKQVITPRIIYLLPTMQARSGNISQVTWQANIHARQSFVQLYAKIY